MPPLLPDQRRAPAATPRDSRSSSVSQKATAPWWAGRASAEEPVGWGLLVEPWWIGFGVVAPARWSALPRDSTRGADDQPTVGKQPGAPAAGETLDAVVPAAQAAEVLAVGRSAVGVGDAMVD